MAGIFPNGLMPAIRNNSNALLQGGLGLLSGPTAQQQAALGAAGFAGARQQAQQKNATLAYLQKVNPELAQAFEQGLVGGKEVGQYLIQAQMPKEQKNPYMSLGEGRLFNWQTGEFKNAPQEQGGFNKDAFETEQKVRKEYTAEDVTTEYNKIRSSFERLRSSAVRAGSDTTGASDLAIVFNYMKMLDPGSVVRESEFRTAALSGGLGAQMQNIVQSIVNGKRLTPEQRMEFVKTAEAIYTETSQNMGELNKTYEGIAGQYGIDPSRVVRSPEAYAPLDLSGYSDAELEAIANGG